MSSMYVQAYDFWLDNRGLSFQYNGDRSGVGEISLIHCEIFALDCSEGIAAALKGNGHGTVTRNGHGLSPVKRK